MLVATILPIHSLVQMEQKVLQDKRKILFILHDNLQDYIVDDLDQLKENKVVNNRSVLFIFAQEDKLMKGCAIWENAKQKEETVCLYGIKE